MIKTLYEKFQPWSSHGSIYIFSDPHFGEEDMRLMCGYISPEKIVENINSKVNKMDTLVLLGDIGDETYLNQIRTKNIILLLGNHDKGESIYKPYCKEVYAGPLMIAEKILLSHEPVETNWCLNIHGHKHDWLSNPDIYHYNTAANVVGFRPVNLKDIIASGALKNINSLHRQAIEKQKNGKK